MKNTGIRSLSSGSLKGEDRERLFDYCLNPSGDFSNSISLLRDECLVRLEPRPNMTKSKLLFIPATAELDDAEIYQGFVLATGPGLRHPKTGTIRSMDVKVGDRILFYWHHGEAKSAVKLGKDLRILAEWQIQACWPGIQTLEEALA